MNQHKGDERQCLIDPCAASRERLAPPPPAPVLLSVLLFILHPSPSSLLPAAADEDRPSSPGARYRTLNQNYTKALAEHQKALAAAKTDEERQKIAAKAPNVADHAAKFLSLAKTNPDSDAAVDALVWVVTHP